MPWRLNARRSLCSSPLMPPQVCPLNRQRLRGQKIDIPTLYRLEKRSKDSKAPRAASDCSSARWAPECLFPPPSSSPLAATRWSEQLTARQKSSTCAAFQQTLTALGSGESGFCSVFSAGSGTMVRADDSTAEKVRRAAAHCLLLAALVSSESGSR